MTVAVLVSTLQDAASPCDAAATAEAITPADGGTGSLPVPELPTDSVVDELPTDSVLEDLPTDSVLPVTVPEIPVTLPTG